MSITRIEPTVKKLEPGTDWIGFLGKIAATSTRADGDDSTKARRRVEHCYLNKHVGVFEHWPITLTTTPPKGERGVPNWRRLGSKYHGNLRMCIDSWNEETLPIAEINSWILQSKAAIPKEALHTFQFECSRKAAMQLRTYRSHTSHIVESTRYCNYAKLGFEYVELGSGIVPSYDNYSTALEAGHPPEEAAAHLPLCTRTTIVTTAPLWQWERIVAQRAHHVTGRAQEEISGLIAQVAKELGV